jgi:hypothetical protein
MHLEMLERHIIRDDRGSSIASLRGIVLISCYLNLTQSLLDRYIMFLDKQIIYSTILKSTLYHPPINVGQKNREYKWHFGSMPLRAALWRHKDLIPACSQ